MKEPMIGGLYEFKWPMGKPTMRIVGRVKSITGGADARYAMVDYEGKEPYKVMLTWCGEPSCTWKMASELERCCFQMKVPRGKIK